MKKVKIVEKEGVSYEEDIGTQELVVEKIPQEEEEDEMEDYIESNEY